MKKTPFDEISILHLSDLHVSPIEFFKNRKVPRFVKKFWRLFLEEHNPETSYWHITNLKLISEALSSDNEFNLRHVAITGDCVTCGLEEEFNNVYSALVNIQNNVFNKNERLDPDYFSVVPGNHDVSNNNYLWRLPVDFPKILMSYYGRRNNFGKRLENFGNFKKNYYLFKKTFSDLYPDNSFDHLNNSIYCRELPNTNVNFVHLISSTSVPINHFLLNPLGNITEEQLNELAGLDENKFNILLMHHPPLPPPSISMEGPFLELINGQKLYGSLIKNKKVNLVLCGHHHVPFIWDNASLPKDIPDNYNRYDVPILSAGASTQMDENGRINVPIYKIQTANTHLTKPNNSNVIVLNCSIDDSGIDVRQVCNLTPFKLGNSFNCLKVIWVNGEGPSTLTAINNTLQIDNPTKNDYLCVPFDKPAEPHMRWIFHISGADKAGEAQKNKIDISIIDSNHKNETKITQKRIGTNSEPIEFTTNTRSGGFIKITIVDASHDNIALKRIENVEKVYL